MDTDHGGKQNQDTEIKGSELGHRWCENKGNLSRISEQKHNKQTKTQYKRRTR